MQPKSRFTYQHRDFGCISNDGRKKPPQAGRRRAGCSNTCRERTHSLTRSTHGNEDGPPARQARRRTALPSRRRPCARIRLRRRWLELHRGTRARRRGDDRHRGQGRGRPLQHQSSGHRIREHRGQTQGRRHGRHDRRHQPASHSRAPWANARSTSWPP